MGVSFRCPVPGARTLSGGGPGPRPRTGNGPGADVELHGTPDPPELPLTCVNMNHIRRSAGIWAGWVPH